MLYPMKLKASLKEYLWGGTRLKTEYNKETDLETVAESWELACHKDGRSIITNGEFAGMELEHYIALKGDRVLGSHAYRYSYFPLLVKLIDAARDLSVQVHPANSYALEHEGQYGKTELWYVVDAQPGASLIYGFKREITPTEFRRRIEDNTLLEVCNRVPAHKGDIFFIDAGTLHSIGAGIVLAEVQQNSNLTYRVYDYGRIGKDGNQRELHIDKAMAVTKLTPSVPQVLPAPLNFLAEYDMRLIGDCEFFTVYHLAIHGRCHLQSGPESFQHLLVLDGILEMEYRSGLDRLEKGDSVFIPAGYGEYWIRGTGSLLLSYI